MVWRATRSWPVRVLLDEQLPLDLAAELVGHEVHTVVGLGWQGVTNGDLLRRASGRFEALVTMDRNLEFQQNLDVISRAAWDPAHRAASRRPG